MKSILSQKSVEKILAALQGEKEYVFLDTIRLDEENQKSLLFLKPEARLDFFSGDDPHRFLRQVEKIQASGKYLAGWLGYEFGYLLEPQLESLLPQFPPNRPLASFGVFAEAICYDHLGGKCCFPQASEPLFSLFSIDNIRLSQQKADYLAAINKIKEYIGAGDTYQVNYTIKLLFELQGAVESLYGCLRANQSVAYGALIRLGNEQIASLSPELFFRVKENTITVRPMKGTMRRGRYLQEDNAFCEQLHLDPKNRSENVMIVDLLRNDLGRLTHGCGDSKVVTKSLFDVERYESVLQMTSTVFTETKKNIFSELSLVNILRALFPCGSVTGAPKIRTMEIIGELESGTRGVYTGAIGYFAPDGEAVFNVPIRTVHVHNGHGEMGIGSGIVQDSVAENEWEECLLKGHFLTKPFALFTIFETILLEKEGGYWLLDFHLERMQRSAFHFSFCFDKQYIQDRLAEVEQKNQSSALRVRFALQKDGEITIKTSPCSAPQFRSLPKYPNSATKALPQVRLSDKRVDSKNPFFFHKTSNRELFKEEFSKACKEGLFDILFQNEKEEITEGAISNIILYKAGKYLTPPLSSALLAGTMRQKLLDDMADQIIEQPIFVDDLRQADAIFCCNAIRGVVQVRFGEEKQ